MFRSLRFFSYLIISFFSLVCLSVGRGQDVLLQSAATPGNLVRDRIVGAIRDSEVVTLTGNLHPMASVDFDMGTVAEETRLERMMLLIQPDAEQQKRLDALSEAQQDPASPLFRQWLSPEQYGARFGASDHDLARITRWLASHGFAVEAVPAGRRLILFSGTSAQVADTFHTEIHQYRVDGQLHIANNQDPQIPKALSPVVAGIVSLHDFRRNSEAHMGHAIADPGAARQVQALTSHSATPESTQGGAHYMFPADLATIYDLNPLYKSGLNGNGTSIAIVGRSNIKVSDVNSFRSYAGLAVNAPTVTVVGRDPGLVSGDQDEATLDVEWAGGVAPKAKVKLVVAASTATSDGVDIAAQYIVNNKSAQVMSTSFGNCESQMGATEIAFYNSLWQQATAEGISAFVSSGDSGASGCDAGSSSKGTGAAVNGLCSSPYATCVGGTEFDDGNASSIYWGTSNGAGGDSVRSYIREKVWNESGSAGGKGLWASGGGISGVFVQPSWQRSVAGANSNGMRAVPDVALNAASHDGYLVLLNNNWYDFSGTSASSPSFAAIMAVLVQKENGAGQGSVNPGLYRLLSASADPFHATPSGNNSVPGVGGFTASGAAYNLATGLGSVDANVLVKGWAPPPAAVAQGFSIKASTASFSLLAGKSTSFTVAVTATGGFKGQVSLTTAKLPSGLAIQFNPAVVAAGSTSTATITAVAGATAGSSSVLLTGTSGSLESTSAIGIVVQQPPTISVTTTTTSVTVVRGHSSALQVKVLVGGSFSSPVTLAVTGVPAYVTASWSALVLHPSGAGILTSTLTLTASSNAPLTNGMLKITATGDSLQAHTLEAVQVSPAPAIAFGLSSTKISMSSTASVQIVATVTPIGGVKPASNGAGISFQALGAPAGVVAAWGKPSVSATGLVQATLTLTGSKSAVLGTTALSIQAGVIDTATKVRYIQALSPTVTVTK